MKQSQIDRAYAQLEAAAVAGERCPLSEQVPGGSKSFSELARTGRILVEVYMHNFRRVTILTGEHRGKHTKNAPLDQDSKPRKPHLIVSTSGTFRNGVPINVAGKRSKPVTIKDYSGGW